MEGASMAGFFIGTSGWNYKHWDGLFYPADLAKRRWLDFYSQHFNTAEVNYSFYRLPSPSTYEKWLTQVPEDFLFSLKCSRLITHAKRLNTLGDLWQNFLRNAVVLGDQLGPILCQFPDNFQADAARLNDFLSSARSAVEHNLHLRLATEFRHESWFTPAVYRVLEKHNVALVIASSSVYPHKKRITADFAYCRYHGPGALFGSRYSEKQIETEARMIEKFLEDRLDAYAYFNNDGHAYAVKNALQLQRLLTQTKRAKVS
jgi:uncharacterized protein YecE (DUF72 family)